MPPLRGSQRWNVFINALARITNRLWATIHTQADS
jgi:hypothetical protein